MAADIEQNNFLFRHLERQGDAVTVRDADGMQSLQFAFEGVQPQMWLQGIVFKITQNLREARAEVGVGLRKLFGGARKPGGPD